MFSIIGAEEIIVIYKLGLCGNQSQFKYPYIAMLAIRLCNELIVSSRDHHMLVVFDD